MGLFGWVRCEYPLPEPAHQDLEYQTKDFGDPYLEHYRISAGGRLLKERYRFEPIPEAERDWSDRKLGRTSRAVHDGWDDLAFHGDLRFYGGRGDGHAREWVEYIVRFTEGQAGRVWRVEEDAPVPVGT